MSDLLVTALAAEDFEPVATRYRADCLNCGTHAVMKIRRPLTKAQEVRPTDNPWTCVICGGAVVLEYPEGKVG